MQNLAGCSSILQLLRGRLRSSDRHHDRDRVMMMDRDDMPEAWLGAATCHDIRAKSDQMRIYSMIRMSLLPLTSFCRWIPFSCGNMTCPPVLSNRALSLLSRSFSAPSLIVGAYGVTCGYW